MTQHTMNLLTPAITTLLVIIVAMVASGSVVKFMEVFFEGE